MSSIVRYRQDGTIIPSRSEYMKTVRMGEAEASDAGSVAAAINRLSEQLEYLSSRLPPRAKEFEYTSFAGTSADAVVIPHGFNNRVRWWVCNADSDSALSVIESPSTTNEELVLIMDNSAGAPRLVTIRVEVAA